jgi:hypothetical protein
MSGASTAGSVLTYDDGERTVAPWEDRPGYGQADLVSADALRWMGTPASEIRQIRPPVPQVLFPPRWGYVQEPLTIEDIFYGNWTPQPRSWVSPPRRSIRRAYEEDTQEAMWGGTGMSRNPAMSVNPML